LSFKIKNIGKGELTGSVGTPAAPFSVTAGSDAFDLAPGATQTITVQFAPTAVGHVSQPLVISVTAPGKPVAGITVTLSGRGT
jgi:subtilase family serine protease